VAFGADFIPDFFDFAVRADEERAADDAEERATEKFLHAARAVGFDRFQVGIAEKIEIEFVFGFKAGLRFNGIAAHAEDHGVELIEVLFCVAKLGRFDGSTGSVGFWIEEEDNAFAAEVGERDFGAGVVFDPECGSFIAFF
jgi:hypothetical protein